MMLRHLRRIAAWRWLWSVVLVCWAMSYVETSEALPLDSPFCRHVVFPLGYSCVEYKVTTDDGFILVLHRLSTWYVATRTVETERSQPMEVTPAPEATSDNPFEAGFPHKEEHVELQSEPAEVASPVSRATDEHEQPFHPWAPPSPKKVYCQDDEPREENNCKKGERMEVAPTPVSVHEQPFIAAPRVSTDDYGKPFHVHRTGPTAPAPSPFPAPAPVVFGSSLIPPSSSPAAVNVTMIMSPLTYIVSTPIPAAPVAPGPSSPWPYASPPSYSPAANVPASFVGLTSNSPSPSAVNVSPPSPDPPTALSNSELSPALSPVASNPESGPLGPSQIPSQPFQQGGTESSPPSAHPGGAPDASTPIPEVGYPQMRLRRGPPVLLMHPEFLNGDSWFTPTYSPGDRFLPLLMVDAGYDVWLGHHRATNWGHEHVWLQPNQPEYWNWTWDDRAQYDIPAFLNLINAETQSTAHYIGVSESATVGAAAATRPVVAQLLKSLTLLGPTIYRGYTNSLVLQAWAYIFGSGLDQAYYAEGFQHGAFNYSAEFPLDAISGQGPMAILLDTISGPNCCLGSAVIRFNNGWDGTTSFKNLLHYQQAVRTNTWQHFDYGAEWRNARAYNGRRFPLAYNPGDIPANLPVFVVFGLRDACAPAAGVRLFLSLLKGQPASLALPSYAHFDLTYSVNRTRDIFIPIVDFLKTSDSV